MWCNKIVKKVLCENHVNENMWKTINVKNCENRFYVKKCENRQNVKKLWKFIFCENYVKTTNVKNHTKNFFMKTCKNRQMWKFMWKLIFVKLCEKWKMWNLCESRFYVKKLLKLINMKKL